MSHAIALEPKDLVGVIILVLLTLGLGFLVFYLERRARKAHKELTKKGGLVRKSRFDRVKKRFSGEGETNASGESLNDADMVDDGNFRGEDVPKPLPHFGRFDEDNCNSDDESFRGQSQDMGQLGKEVTTLGRQVGFLTEVVCRLREDVVAMRQHLDINDDDVNMGAKLVDREHSTGAVSLISTWTPMKQAECLSAASSVEQPTETNRDAPRSEKVRERPPRMHPDEASRVQVNL